MGRKQIMRKFISCLQIQRARHLEWNILSAFFCFVAFVKIQMQMETVEHYAAGQEVNDESKLK